jgi:hypothetical protein
MGDEHEHEPKRFQSLPSFTANVFRSLRGPIEEEMDGMCAAHPDLNGGEVAQAACRALASVIAAIIAEGANTEKAACLFAEDIEGNLHDTVHVAYGFVEDAKRKREAVEKPGLTNEAPAAGEPVH